MRVLYVSKASRVMAYRDKLTALAARVDLHTVVPDRWPGVVDEPADPAHPTVECLPVRMAGHNHLHWYRGLGGVMDRVAPDLVHADEEAYSAVTLQVARLCAARRLPFVFFAWQNLAKRLPPPFGLLRGHVYRRAAGGLAGTAAAARVLRDSGFRGPVAVVPQMGVDPERFRPDPAGRTRRRTALGVGPGACLVGYVGRLVREKGVDLLVDAVAAVGDVHAVVVGDGPEAEALRRRAAGAGVGERITFTGGAASADVPGWMAALDVLVLPSRTTPTWSEQFGRVLVEAMACGVPVVVSDSGEMAGVAGPAGSVVPEGRADALAQALRTLLDPGLREERGRIARARVLELFTQERVAADTVAFYRTLGPVGAG
ncbi:MAG: glycosyltransferase family 4 protein [Longimicrobiales bacterium]